MDAADEEPGSQVLRQSADPTGIQDDDLGLYLPMTWCSIPSEQVDRCKRRRQLLAYLPLRKATTKPGVYRPELGDANSSKTGAPPSI